MRIYVDEIETGFTELTACLKDILRRNGKNCGCGFCTQEVKKKDELKDGNAYIIFIVLFYNV
jgi:hypothetical protein